MSGPSVKRPNGVIRLENPEEMRDLRPISIRYDRNKFQADFETIPIEDARLQSSWGNQLYRILLTAKEKSLKDEFSIRIE